MRVGQSQQEAGHSGANEGRTCPPPPGHCSQPLEWDRWTDTQRDRGVTPDRQTHGDDEADGGQKAPEEVVVQGEPAAVAGRTENQSSPATRVRQPLMQAHQHPTLVPVHAHLAPVQGRVFHEQLHCKPCPCATQGVQAPAPMHHQHIHAQIWCKPCPHATQVYACTRGASSTLVHPPHTLVLHRPGAITA